MHLSFLIDIFVLEFLNKKLRVSPAPLLKSNSQLRQQHKVTKKISLILCHLRNRFARLLFDMLCTKYKVQLRKQHQKLVSCI